MERPFTSTRESVSMLGRSFSSTNLRKCEFVKAHVQYLGYIVGQGKVCPPFSKVEAIAKICRGIRYILCVILLVVTPQFSRTHPR